MFKVGDRVRSNSQGEGTISNINMGNHYPISVEFDNGNRAFTFRLDGHFNKEENKNNKIYLIADKHRQYSRLEMINMFYADNELEFIQIIDSVGNKSELIVNKNNISSKYPWCENDKAVYILKPIKELKKMSFADVFKLWQHMSVNSKDIKSVKTDETFNIGFANISEKAIDNLWIVEGIYE